jgi:hypothetical protein
MAQGRNENSVFSGDFQNRLSGIGLYVTPVNRQQNILVHILLLRLQKMGPADHAQLWYFLIKSFNFVDHKGSYQT